jgi:hypothetical protein
MVWIDTFIPLPRDDRLTPQYARKGDRKHKTTRSGGNQGNVIFHTKLSVMITTDKGIVIC